MAHTESLLSRRAFVEATGAQILSSLNDSTCHDEDGFCFTSVSCDSRSVVRTSLFVPLIGIQQNGHHYIPHALENGASVVLIASDEYCVQTAYYDEYAKIHTNVSFAVVPHTLTALQDCARAYLDRFPHMIRIGITGSNGKTSTKEIALSVLSSEFRTIANEGNLNSETGLPLSVFRVRNEHQVGIFEMGMNRRGEIAELTSVLRPCFGIITNIGTAHIGILGSREAIAEEKKSLFSLFTSGDVAFIPCDDDFADFLAKDVCASVVRYGISGACVVINAITDLGLQGYSFTYKDHYIRFPLVGIHNLKNAVAVIALAEEMGIAPHNIKKGLECVSASLGRSHVIQGAVTIIDDCYNANAESMCCALDLCDTVAHEGRKIYVLGDIKELGSEAEAVHRSIGCRLASSRASRIYLYGADMAYAAESYRQAGKEAPIFHTCDSEVLRSLLAQEVFSGDMVLLKASHSMALDSMIETLRGIV